MLLSIIIPTLNEEKYLPILLSSLVLQTNKQFEVIVIDGKSEDNTKEKALEFSGKLNIKVFDSDKENLCYQRNLGAKKAKGDCLIFIDADHWVDNNFIELIYQEIAETKADVIIPMCSYDTKKLFWRAYSSFLHILVRVAYILFKKPLGSGPTLIIRKNVFEKTGGYDESIFYFEDHSLLQSISKFGAKFRHSRKINVHISTRRMDKIGILKFCKIDLIASSYFIFRGPIRKRIFEYKMGGQEHEIAS